MCRWIAYRGETTALEHYVTEPAHSLISQSIQALESTASINGDGFGLGWYGSSIRSRGFIGKSARPGRMRTCAICAGTCSRICSSPMSGPPPAPPITRANCHPFASGNWMFMHNGFVGSWGRLRRQVEGLIPDELYPARASARPIRRPIFLAMHGRRHRTSGGGGGNVRWRELTEFVNQNHAGRPLALHRGAVERTGPLRFSLRGERSAPIRCITGKPIPASSSCPSRSIAITRAGSRCRRTTSLSPWPANARRSCRCCTAISRRRSSLAARYGFQSCCHAAGVLPSISMKAMRHGLVPLLTQA